MLCSHFFSVDMIPSVLESGNRYQLQLNETFKSILETSDDERNTFIIFKWLSSSTYAPAEQKSNDSEEGSQEKSIFIATIVPIALVDST